MDSTGTAEVGDVLRLLGADDSIRKGVDYDAIQFKSCR